MPRPDYQPVVSTGWRYYLFRLLFRYRERDERMFDVVLLAAILASVVIAILDSVQPLHERWGTWFYLAEWVFTLLFTVEYILRLLVVQQHWRYARSFFGVVDLVAMLPTYLSFLLPGSEHLIVIRVLRVLRVFRVFELTAYVGESSQMMEALRRSRRKIGVFVLSVLLIATVFGSLMYLVEGPEHGYTSIPRGIYWAIVTMATVGYGDITPQTPLGQFITTIIIIIGYGIIAVPTGIYTSELVQATMPHEPLRCAHCGFEGIAREAHYCAHCGKAVGAQPESSAKE
jgi:voltage-gated potassium channel